MPRRFIACMSSVLPMSRLMIGLAGGFSANAASTTPLGAVPCAEAIRVVAVVCVWSTPSQRNLQLVPLGGKGRRRENLSGFKEASP
jgi:hypothetical protein